MPPINYNTELGQARAHAIALEKRQRKCTTNGLGCWLFIGSKNTDGYGQVFAKKNSNTNQTGRGAQTAFLLHIVSYISRGQGNPQGHVSHLCDNRACFNPDHLVDEPAQANNSRKGCPGPCFCQWHGHLILNLCAHSPTCIRPPRTDMNCCLKMRQEDPQWRDLALSQQTEVSRHWSPSQTGGSASTSRQHSRQSSRQGTPSQPPTVSPYFANAMTQTTPQPDSALYRQRGIQPSQQLQQWMRAASSDYEGADDLQAAIEDGEL